MSLLGRAKVLVKTSVGALLAPAEDPRAGFADAYQRQRLLLRRVRSALTDVGAARGRLEERASTLNGELPFLEEQARAAVISGQEDLARLRLRRREVVAALVRSLGAQLSGLEREEANLALIEQRLATEIDAFYARQEVIAARYTAAEAQVRINESLTGVTVELRDLGLALEQAEEGAELMRARAAAIEELAAAGQLSEGTGIPTGSDLDGAVETQLAALRASFERS
jgi:phage shock protein A